MAIQPAAKRGSIRIVLVVATPILGSYGVPDPEPHDRSNHSWEAAYRAAKRTS